MTVEQMQALLDFIDANVRARSDRGDLSDGVRANELCRILEKTFELPPYSIG